MARSSSRLKSSKPPELGLQEFQQPAEEAGVSLDQLSAAFAEMLTTGEDPYQDPVLEVEEEQDHSEGESADTTGRNEADRACSISPRTILEAMLFVGAPNNQPLLSTQVAGLMRGVRPSEIDSLVRELNHTYDQQDCPYHIVAEGSGYRLALRQQFDRVRDRFYGKTREARLSQAAIEVLALVAYNQPLTADEVNKLRGVSSGAILSQLVRRELLRIDRSSDPPSRQGRYGTTPRFLKLFGLESLQDLPRSEEQLGGN